MIIRYLEVIKMPFMKNAPVKIAWDKLHNAALASEAAYSPYPVIDEMKGWKAVNIRAFDGGGIPRKNIHADGLTFITDDERGAAVFLHSGTGANKKYILTFRGTDTTELASLSKTDVIGWVDALNGRYIDEFWEILKSVDAHIKKHPGELIVTGHSLGGWIVNNLKGDIADFGGSRAIWNNATYAAFESPSLRRGIFNFGFQNDGIYNLLSPLSPLSPGLGPERIWIDNGPGAFRAHEVSAAVATLQLIHKGSFQSRIDFNDNIFVRTAHAKGETVDHNLVKPEWKHYSANAESFVFGSKRADAFELRLVNHQKTYVDLGAGGDVLHSIRNARDVIIGKEGRDTIHAGSGSDIVSGDSHIADHGGLLRAAHIRGTAGIIYSTWFGPPDGLTTAAGAYEQAQLHGGSLLPGKRSVLGSADKLFGENGNDVVFGGRGNDILHGGNNSDLLLGGRGDDRIYGGQGPDALYGGPGADVMVGGAGHDLYMVDDFDFIFESDSGGTDVAVLMQDGSYDLGNIEEITLAQGVKNVTLHISELGEDAYRGIKSLFVILASSNVTTVIDNGAQGPTAYILEANPRHDNTFTFTRPFVEGSRLETIGGSWGSDSVFFDVSSLGFKGVIGKTLDLTLDDRVADGIYAMDRTSSVRFRDEESKVVTWHLRDYNNAENILDGSFYGGFPYIDCIASVRNGVFHMVVDVDGWEIDWII